MDKNHDHRVTPDEFGGALPFASFDQNKDGAISKAEFLEMHYRMFMKFDADGDKRISPSEFATAQHVAGK
jgi:Ca2+-binding EF-hand superfamily protein